jgi:FAD/FMN-containing dehydrogenase
MNEFVSSLSSILRADQIKTDPKDLQFYGKDWTTYFDIKALAIVFPETTQEIQKLVLWARQNKIPLVPSGGRTGLSGGACATQNELVVSLERMNQIIEFNKVDQTLLCQAGVVTEQIQRKALDEGFLFPIDFAARGSSHIGGNVATNAGGIKVVKYGMTRNWITGLTVVTGRGDIIKLNQGLIKNATGPNLLHHFIGSEGIYGIITEVEVRLTHIPPKTQTLLFSVSNLHSIMHCYQSFKQETELHAFEFFSDIALRKVLEHKKKPAPFEQSAPYYIVLEVEASHELAEAKLMEVFERCLEQGWIQDGLIAQSSEQTKLFWSYREEISECLAPFSPYKNDVSVRISKVPEFLTSVNQVISKHYPDWTVVWFGHIGDGNLHINILRPEGLTREDFIKKCQNVDQLLFETVAQFHGAISAEHGVGLTKKPFLHFSKSKAEIETLKALKAWYDPDFILNPGKVFDL